MLFRHELYRLSYFDVISEPISRILSWTIIHLCPTSPLGCTWVASLCAVPRFTPQLYVVSSLLATPSPHTLLRGGRLIRLEELPGSPDFPRTRHLRPGPRSSSPLMVCLFLLLRCPSVEDLVCQAGIEPTTFGLATRCSAKLSY